MHNGHDDRTRALSAMHDRAAVDLAEASRFLDLMAEGEPITFQSFDDDAGRKTSALATVMHGTLEQHAVRMQTFNERGAGIFWCVNYTDGEGRRTENVTGVRALFLDLDGAPLAPVLAAAPEPHAVVESSHGKYHVYWLISGCELAQFKAAQQVLAAKFGGDPSVNDLPRVLRVPGFLHRKGEPFRTRIVSLEAFQPYQFGELVQRLGLDLSAASNQMQRIDADTGEMVGKVQAGGRHEHLRRKLADMNWRGIPEAGIRAALHQINATECDPPKTPAEVDALVSDWLKRYAAQRGRDGKPAAESPSSGGVRQQADGEPPDPLAALKRWFVTDEQVAEMTETRMIWRAIIAASHLAVWSAPANGGKTTLAKLAAGELASDHTVLFFQEDASAGDLPALHQHAKEHGYRLLNSTLANSTPDEQIRVLRGLARDCVSLDGMVMFFDTLKKYTDLMSKGGTRAFFQLMRSLTQRGATVVLLGHTNKHKGPDGKMVFEGVGDVRNDVDELLYIEATDKDAAGIVTLTIKPDKVRCAVREATFELDTKTMHVRPLAHVVNVSAVLEANRRLQEDARLIEAATQALASGGMNYWTLIERTATDIGESRNAVRRVVDRYLTEDPSDPRALWTETRMRANNTRYIALKPRGQS